MFLHLVSYSQYKDNHSLVLKVNATSFVDQFSFPTVQIGLEKGISKNISLAIEFGYQLYTFDDPDTLFTDEEGMKASFEIRYYGIFKKLKYGGENAKGMNGFYGALNLFYRQNKYNEMLMYERRATLCIIFIQIILQFINKIWV